MQEAIALGDISVAIGIPVGRSLPLKTVASLVQTCHRLATMGIPYDVLMESVGSVVLGRDAVLDDFLLGKRKKLFWIDSDMVWTADDFIRMLALSTKVDVVCGAYPAKVEGPPTFFVGTPPGNPAPGEYGLAEITGIGLGFTIVDRAVLDKLVATKPRVFDQISKRDMAEVFRIDTIDGHRRTEDMAFFADVRELGYKVWLDPTISLGHIGDREWRGSIMDGFTPQLVEAAA